MTNDVRRGRFFAGVDVGASTAKAVVISEDGAFLGGDVRASGMDFGESGGGALAAAAAAANVDPDEIVRVVATGYGRDNQPSAHSTRTEITCHGRGAYHHHPHAMVVIDIGGQDNKIIRLAEDGKRLGFRMNRKCAAGTGAFLEEISPLNRAGEIRVPLLVAQGANDPRVPASEAEQIVEAVRGDDNTVWYLLAGDEGHGFRKKPNRDYLYEVMFLFLEQYLLAPEAAPDAPEPAVEEGAVE